MVTNEELTERIMRMGIEYRYIGDISKLYSLAAAQIKEEKIENIRRHHEAASLSGKQKTLCEYANHCKNCNTHIFVCTYISEKLQIVRLNGDENHNVFSWRLGGPYPFVRFI